MKSGLLNLAHYEAKLNSIRPLRMVGRVTRVTGPLIHSHGPAASIGDVCYLDPGAGRPPVMCEVVGFQDRTLLLMAFHDAQGIRSGSRVVWCGKSLSIGLGEALLGRVVGALGEPIDGLGPLKTSERRSIYGQAPAPLERRRITTAIGTGVRAIDAFVTLGRGQRVGIFAGSGVGKSVLLGQIARSSEADVNVIALIGERGREVRDFLENNLGQDGLARSVVVAVTSDQPALRRIKGALVATTIAEYFRDQGRDVMLLMDSLTRFAMAQREVGLSAGEPPTTRGYTPSVFALMPKLLERAGTSDHGSITGLYSVLVEGDDMDEPISDHARSILDGHIVLSRSLAMRHHYPAVDILASVSRVMPDVTTPEHRSAAQVLKTLYAAYEEARDLIHIGAYAPGSSAQIDAAIAHIDAISAFLRQDPQERTCSRETIRQLEALAAKASQETRKDANR